MTNTQFETEWNGQKINLEIRGLTPRVQAEAEIYVNKAFQKAIQDGYMLACQIDGVLSKTGYDLESEQRQIKEYDKKIRDSILALYSGRLNGKKLNKLDGRKLALEIKDYRSKMNQVNQSRMRLYQQTAERAADLERWNYFIYGCLIDPKTNKTFFASYEEFQNSMDTKLVLDAVMTYAKSRAGGQTQEPEDKWLIKFGYMNENFELIDNKGRLVDNDFRLVDKEGYFVNEDNKRVDIYGNLLDTEGELVLEVDAEAYSE